uniref:Uncharacterized protein n=1 Tax=Anopheles dirus TaxID=7168 RepID=A0A182NLT4_9DIPT
MYHEHRSSSTIPYRDRLAVLWLLGPLMVLLAVRYRRQEEDRCTLGADATPDATNHERPPTTPPGLHQTGRHPIGCCW